MNKNAPSFVIDTSIPDLGRATLPSPLPKESLLASKRTVTLTIDKELVSELNEPVEVDFELAGAREDIFFDPRKTKCAIVTCGGLCPGLNDVIRAIVMAAHYRYGVRSVWGVRYGLKGLIPSCGLDLEELTPERVSQIHEFGGTILGTSRGPQDPAEIVDALVRLNINILFLIGGDGTMRAAAAIYEEVKKQGLKLSIIGIPKTIDNDINLIPQSFGFETAVEKATEALRSAHTEAESVINGIGLVKLMGRESGFIAATATVSLREANFVLVPEVPFTMEGPRGFLPALEKRLKNRKHALIVVAEGAGQNLIDAGTGKDASGNRVLGDIAGFLVSSIKEYLGARNIPYHMKYIDPSYMIRAVPANVNDRLYCATLGKNAVHAAMAGKTGMVVGKIMDRHVHLPLHLVVQKRRTMRPDSELWHGVLEATGQDEHMGAAWGGQH